MNVASWLSSARRTISPLDADLLMLTALGKTDRSQLILCESRELTPDELHMLESMLALRRHFIPIAYLTGHKEFYGRDFKVTPAVLIPRPETEAIIALAESLPLKDKVIVDVGTGSGCLAITLALETKAEKVIGLDLSPDALDIAKQNAKTLGAQVSFKQSDLLSALQSPPDLIVANLPYVDQAWEWTSPEIQFEPPEALYAENGGLALIYRLLAESSAKDLILEADPSQHARIIARAAHYHYTLRQKQDFTLAFHKAP